MRVFQAFLFFATASVAFAIYEVAIEPANRLTPDAPAWRDLVEAFVRQPDITADFEERRFFPFRNEPVVLRGEVRVSRERGLSLHYTAPEERIIILDAQGMLLREPSGQKNAPPDPRAKSANDALRHILRFDFAALEKDFELYGRRISAEWSLALVPRAEALQRTIGNIYVSGEGAVVRTIELRRSLKQHIDITIAAPHSSAAFSAEELKRYFR